MNETMIIGQEPKVEKIPFLVYPESKKPLILNYDMTHPNWYSHLDSLMHSRDVTSAEKRIVILFMGGISLALTIRLKDMYLLGINPIEAKDLEKPEFITSFQFTNEEISYSDTKDVEISRETLLDTMHYISKSLGLKELDVNCLKLLIFFTSEAARFETVRFSILNALKGAKPSQVPRLHWVNHLDILHNWKTLQDFAKSKGVKDYNTVLDVYDMIAFIKENPASPAAQKIREALIKMQYPVRIDNSLEHYIYLNNYRFEGLKTQNLPDTIVGSGYDVINGEYISMQGAKVANPIIDMEKPVKFVSQNYIKSDVMKAEGSTLKETMMHFNAKLKVDTGFYIFTGSAETEFDITSKNQYEYSYFRFYSKFINKREYLNGDIYKRYLTEDFKNDINNMEDIDLLFSKYGTHMIKEILIGGRLAFSFTYHKESSENQQSISARVNAAFGEYLKVHSTAEYSSNAKYVASKSNICVSTFGGEHCELHTLELFAKNYPKWLESLKNPQYWSPCDIVDMTNMIPIWHLCNDKKRSSEIEQRYYELLYQRTKKLYPALQFLNTDIFVTRGKTDFDARKKCPTDYNMVYKNIHKGVSNNFSYLCCKPFPLPGRANSIMALFVFHADIAVIKDCIPVRFENKTYKCISLGYFNQFVENGKRFYTHLMVARIPENQSIGAIQVVDIDILYGDSQLPKDWNYATSVNVPDMPENCNKGYEALPSYIIYKRKFYKSGFKS